jgi:hypothetical protein
MEDSMVVDPTENVKHLVVAESRRQDDLRNLAIEGLRSEARIHAQYADKLRDAEAKRIDAIRSVDVGAVSRAADVSTAVAATLAAQVATTAETLRSALSSSLEPIIKDIADLRRVQYEQVGSKAQVVEGRQSNAAVMAAIAFGVTLIFLLLGIAGFVLTRIGR